MKLAGCFARESSIDGRVLEATSEPKDQSTKRLVLPVPPDAEILFALHLGGGWSVRPEQARISQTSASGRPAE